MRRNSSASVRTSNKGDAKEQSLADSDLAAMNAALQLVATERIRAQDLWEQADNSKGLGLPQILDDSAIKALRGQRAVFDG